MNGLNAKERTPWGRIALVWLAISILMLVVNWHRIVEGRFLDPDDTLRLVQVRDLLAGQGWFDLHQYRVDPGASPVMHWSRIVDVPLALGILLFKPLLGQATAEHITVIIVPLLTLLALMAIVGRMAFRLFDKEIAGLACLACGFSPLLLTQFEPLRIDHHAWQIVSVMFALGALMSRRPWVGGVVAGLAIATGLSVSMEVLPFAAIFAAVLLLRWLRDPAQRWWLSGYLSSLAAGLVVLFLATRGVGDLTPRCDVVSPAHLYFFVIVALATSVIATKPKLTPVAVVGLLGLAGVVALALFALQAPQCMSGPFSNLDPLVREYWYDNVMEGRPFWMQPTAAAFPPIVQALIAIAVVAFLWRNSTGERHGWWLDYGLLFCGSLLVGLFVWRSMAFVGAMSAMPIGWLLQRLLLRFRAANGTLARFGVGVAGLVALLPASPVVVAKAIIPAHNWGLNGQLRESSCDLRQSARKLDRFGPVTIFAPVDIGPSLLESTPDSVVATGHHRAQLGMRDVILAFTSPEAQAHAIIRRHGARFLVICTDIAEPEVYAVKAPHGLMAQLLKGKVPSWLQEVQLGTPDTFRVWKVVN